jgi:HTH-type transcriptional regulator/antitoxin HipB
MNNLPLRTPREFGALIKERRRESGLDQGELATRVGVSRLWINQVERGKSGAGIGLILRTLKELGIELVASDGTVAMPSSEPVFTPDINAIIDRARGKKP